MGSVINFTLTPFIMDYLTQYRLYKPGFGRWLSRDPIEEAGGINLYGYVGGNPVNLRDPLGLISTLDLCGNPENVEACEAAGVLPEIKIPPPSSMKTLNSTSELIAKGKDIRKVDALCKRFGGKARDWKKKKGWDENGQEWHWYENNGQKFGWKHAGDYDPF